MEHQDQLLEDGLQEVVVDIYNPFLHRRIYHKDLVEQVVEEMVEIYQNQLKFHNQELLIQVVVEVDQLDQMVMVDQE
jgi:hypothetical protein